MSNNKATDTGQNPKPSSLAERLRDVREDTEGEPAGPGPEQQYGSTRLIYQQGRNVLEDFFKRARSLSPCDTKALGKLAQQITEEVLPAIDTPDNDLVGRGDRHPFLWTLFSESKVTDFIEHTITVAILAAMLGSDLGQQRQEMVRLTLTALLQNVGMLFLVPTILNKRGNLWPDEREFVEKHSETGTKFVRSLGPEWGPVADIVLQIHEREDGSGYPLRLKGSHIHEHAKIIGIADVYVALTHTRPFRQAFTPFEALREIVHGMDEEFAPHLIQALWELLSPLFKGLYVLLNTDWVGRVSEAAGCQPMLPVVELLANASGEPLDPPRVMNLSENPMVFIKEVISEEKVKRLAGLDVI